MLCGKFFRYCRTPNHFILFLVGAEGAGTGPCASAEHMKGGCNLGCRLCQFGNQCPVSYEPAYERSTPRTRLRARQRPCRRCLKRKPKPRSSPNMARPTHETSRRSQMHFPSKRCARAPDASTMAPRPKVVATTLKRLLGSTTLATLRFKATIVLSSRNCREQVILDWLGQPSHLAVRPRAPRKSTSIQ